MKKFIRILALVFLFFNAIGALYGGALLIIDPSGKMLMVPLSFLNGTPFHNFFIPGIILFIANGVLCLTIAILTIRQKKYYEILIVFQGIVLIIWLTVELIMIKYFEPALHISCYTAGIGMLVTGWWLNRNNSRDI